MRAFVCTALFAAVAQSAFAQNGTPLPSSLQIETDRPFYTIGETVNLTVRNNSSFPITLDISQFTIHRGNTIIYHYHEFIMPLTPWVIQPGKTLTLHWQQIDDAEKQVPSGLYQAYVSGHIGNAPSITATANIEIVPKTNGKLVLNTTKNTYKQGETIRAFIVNRTSSKWYTATPLSVYRHQGMLWWFRELPIYTPHIPDFLPSPIEPDGGRLILTWNQKDNADIQVKPGKYHLHLRVYDNGSQNLPLTKFITVVKP